MTNASFKMTNTKNVKMIAEKMQQYLKTSTDPYLRKVKKKKKKKYRSA